MTNKAPRLSSVPELKAWLATLAATEGGAEVALVGCGAPELLRVRMDLARGLFVEQQGCPGFMPRTFTTATGKMVGGNGYITAATDQIRTKCRLAACRQELRAVRWEEVPDSVIERVAQALDLKVTTPRRGL